MPNAKSHSSTPNPDQLIVFDAEQFTAETYWFSVGSVGVHTRFLCWSRLNGPLPRARSKQAAIAGVSLAELTETWREVKTLWRARVTGFLSPLVETERAARDAVRSRASRAGAASAALRAAHQLPLESQSPDGKVLKYRRASPANLKVLVRLSHEILDRNPCTCENCKRLITIGEYPQEPGSPYLELKHRAGAARLSWAHDPELIRKAVDVAIHQRGGQLPPAELPGLHYQGRG